MKFSLWTQYGALNSLPVFNAFRDSLLTNNQEVVYNQPGEIDVIWSVLWKGRMAPNKSIFMQPSKPIVVLEVGGINRSITWKVDLYINQQPIVYMPIIDHTRIDRLNIKPWNQGNNILICCQNPYSEKWTTQYSITQWLDIIISKIRQYSNRPIIIRPHPRALFSYNSKFNLVTFEYPKKISNSYDSFNLSFNDIYLTINYDSNPSPQSIVNGCPVYCNKTNIAYDMSIKSLDNINSISFPDRTNWFYTYSHSEHTLDEIQHGIPTKYLIDYLNFV